MSLRVAAAIAALLIAPQGVAPQVPAEHKKIVDLAAAGRADAAWTIWDTLPKTPETLRLGITLAADTKRLPRGVEIYDALVIAIKSPDAKALTTLALGAATELADSPDFEARLQACAAALRLAPAHAACRRAVEAIAQGRTSSVDDQALAVYALANNGVRPWPDLFGRLEPGMTKGLRLRIAASMTRLPAAERFALVRPLLDDPDQATRYQAVLILADVADKNVLAALRNLQVGPPPAPSVPGMGGPDLVKPILPVVLARHGDETSLATVRDRFSSYTGFVKRNAAIALVAASDPRGTVALYELVASPVDIDRIEAAKAIARIDHEIAKRTVIGALTGGSAAIRPRALDAAGMLGLATERPVYRHLADSSPLVRAYTVGAIAETLGSEARGVRIP